jgi:putative addiction module CopG family antidote
MQGTPKDSAEVKSMPNRTFNLTPDLDEFLCARIEGGRYADTSELVQAALRALDREERMNGLKRAVSQARVEEDEARCIAEIDVFRELWLNQHQPQTT